MRREDKEKLKRQRAMEAFIAPYLRRAVDELWATHGARLQMEWENAVLYGSSSVVFFADNETLRLNGLTA